MSLDLVALPKIDLHVQIEGTIPPVLVRELASRYGRGDAVGSMDWFQPDHRWPGPTPWLDCMDRISGACLCSIAEYEQIVSSYVRRLAQEGVIYAELSVSLGRAGQAGLHEEAVLGAVCEFAATTSIDEGIDIGILVAVDGRSDPEDVGRHVDLAIAYRAEAVVGVDLHGSPVTTWTPIIEAFARARTARLGTRAHAGEAQGAAGVAHLIDVLGVRRVANGIRAIEDPALVERLRRDRVALDVCPSRDVMLGLVPALDAHPVRRLVDAGVPVSIGTAAPLYFHTSGPREYALLRDVHGFSVNDLLAISTTAAEHSFAPADVRARLSARFERFAAGLTGTATSAGGS